MLDDENTPDSGDVADAITQEEEQLAVAQVELSADADTDGPVVAPAFSPPPTPDRPSGGISAEEEQVAVAQVELSADPGADESGSDDAAGAGSPSRATTGAAAPKRRRRAASRPAGAPAEFSAAFAAPSSSADEPATTETGSAPSAPVANAAALFQPPPDVPALPPRPRRAELASGQAAEEPEAEEAAEATDADDSDLDEAGEGGPKRRRRRRGGRRRRKPGGEDGSDDDNSDESDEDAADSSDDDDDGDDESTGNGQSGSANTRRRRRRRRSAGGGANNNEDDPPNTVVHVRESREAADQVTSVRGSTRLEAKKQRRREGREAGRRRAPILTEAEFLARRESVDRVMVVRQHEDRTQIAVLEDNVLAEHYVNRSVSTSMVGNVYLGRVQNVLPSMEAAFVDIGRGRNAVLYAGEVNWDAAGLEGQPKRIELALKSGDAVLVQVTKDPVGHKGARLTSQISLPGRYLVYVPGGSMTGISRRLPDSERSRLKKLLRNALPEGSGVIVRTAAEGATEEQINHDVARLTEQWERLNAKTNTVKAPELLHAEPDLATRVVRDIFNEDFSKLIVSGSQATATIEDYIAGVAPDLADRVSRWSTNEDVFSAHRIDEQLAKALDRKVWLPSGGSLVIDHTEAMTVVDVNTGKFTGQGGNLEETVTRNNLEAAEEIVRQLRLRDTGGIIVIDFIDMVLESNRDLVLRRLLECLGRDRTKHQVAEVTSLGLVQMTRKRIGQGLLETFSTPCECCNGRGVKVQTNPVDQHTGESEPRRRRARPAGPIPGAPQQPKAESEPADDPQAETDTVVGPTADSATDGDGAVSQATDDAGVEPADDGQGDSDGSGASDQSR
ncbi:MAG: Rne/Rng family ribonuclease [Candidatus Nanopelagicales bacterium]